MINKVRRYIESLQLLDKQEKHLVALSGGADSVCLLLVLQQLGYSVEAVHCNFHLRGEESDRDERFCRELCDDKGIPFHIVHFDTRSYAELHKVSIEMAARELRYAYFKSLRKDIDASDVCVAHHKDDNVETVLMNIIRGTGLAGLVGIRPRNGYIIRPLLCVSRKDITDYLESKGQHYVVDSSNMVNDVTRNKLRLDIIPLLKEINPQVQENIVRMTEWLTDVEKITEASVRADLEKAVVREHKQEQSQYADDALKAYEDCEVRISLKELSASVVPGYLLFTFLHPYGFSSEQISEIAEKHENGALWQSKTHTLVVDREYLLLARTKDAIPVMLRIPEDGTYVLPSEEKLKLSVMERTADFRISKEPFVATFDAVKVRFPLVLRNIRQGDRFSPFGMKGTKLVSDYLTDKKRNYFQRRKQLVLEDSNGEIIWLLGERVSSKVAVTDDTIKCVCARYIIHNE